MKLSVAIELETDALAAVPARTVAVAMAPEQEICCASANFVTQIAAMLLGARQSRERKQRETEDMIHLYDEDARRECKAEEHRLSRTV